jgi:hypothetical protein
MKLKFSAKPRALLNLAIATVVLSVALVLLRALISANASVNPSPLRVGYGILAGLLYVSPIVFSTVLVLTFVFKAGSKESFGVAGYMIGAVFGIVAAVTGSVVNEPDAQYVLASGLSSGIWFALEFLLIRRMWIGSPGKSTTPASLTLVFSIIFCVAIGFELTNIWLSLATGDDLWTRIR